MTRRVAARRRSPPQGARLYRTSLDRVGLALAAGGAVGGMFSAILVALGPAPDFRAIPAGFAIGALVTGMLATAIGGPLWLLCHVVDRRGPATAACIGALAGFVLFLAGQTYGLGLFAMPVSDAQTLLFRWISAVATSLILAAVSALIGWTMWRVAYRRVRQPPA